MTKTAILILIFASISFSQTDSVKTFYDNGKIKSEINYLDSVRNGEARFYFDNGNLKKKLNYDNGKVNGLVILYNEDGTPKETYNVDEGVRQGSTSLYDSTGKYITDVDYNNGKKVVKAPVSYNSKDVVDKERAERYEKLWQEYYMKRYQLGAPEAIIKNFFKDDPAYFLTADKLPEPVGGMGMLESKLKQPAQSDKSRTNGVVKILAYINRDGSVLTADIVQSLSKEYDEEAKNLILNTNFIPGRIHNDPVNVQMVISLKFGSAAEETPPPKPN
jgi:TonB family protein